MSKKVFIIDWGHGGSDPGASGNGYIEKEQTMKEGLFVRKYIKETYPDVILYETRNSDKFISIRDRRKRTDEIAAAHGVNNVAFLSLHWNSASNPAAYGWEIWCNYPNTRGEQLAKEIVKNVNGVRGDLHSRGIKYSRGQRVGVVHSSPATVLVEACFIVNKNDIDKYMKVREKMLMAYIDGMANFLGVKKSNAAKPSIPAQPKKVYRVKNIKTQEQQGAYTILENAIKRVDHLDSTLWAVYDGDKIIYPKKHWSDKHFDYLDSIGLGFNERRPDDPLTRGEFAAYMDRFTKNMGKPNPTPEKPKKKIEIIEDGIVDIVKVPLDMIGKLETVPANNSKETVDSMMKRVNGDIAINMSFFWTSAEVKWRNYPINTVVSNFKLINQTMDFSNYGIAVRDNNKITFEKFNAKDKSIEQFAGASPTLVIDGKVNIDHRVDGDSVKHPRSGVGFDDEYFYFVGVSGRIKSGDGMTLKEFADYMVNKHKVKYFVNFDGGASSAIYYGDKLVNKTKYNGATKVCDSLVLTLK